MGWPSLQDYQEAVQNPQTSFGDAELKASTVEATASGLPKPITGSFATVYKFSCETKRIAVRCFSRDFADIQDRYTAISKQLEKTRLPQVVPFKYLIKGVLINGRWYPILKMDWVQGELLAEYVRKNLQKPTALLELAQRVVELVEDLAKAGVAHGDLQHGNILVVNGNIRLIDYDGMFVPALSGRGTHETGHRNFQHPRRSGAEFGPWLDAFSAWVIYISLLALSIAPELWQQFDGGDECLLLRREDFLSPATSQILAVLRSHRDTRLPVLATLLADMTLMDPAAVPLLSGHDLSTASFSQGSGKRPDSVRGSAAWWADHRRKQTDEHSSQQPSGDAGGIPIVQNAGKGSGASWVLDFVDTSAPVALSLSDEAIRRARLQMMISLVAAVGLCGAMVLTVGIAHSLVVALSTGLACAVAFNLRKWKADFEAHPQSIAARKLSYQAVTHARAASTAAHEQAAAERALQNATTARVSAEKRLANEERLAQQSEKDAVAGLDAEVKQRESILWARRTEVDSWTKAELRKCEATHGIEIAHIERLLAELATLEREECGELLRSEQRAHIDRCLATMPIKHEFLPGIGPELKAVLRAHGIVTARDVAHGAVSAVRGFGPERTDTLCEWRTRLEDIARRKMATQLSAEQLKTIRDKYSYRLVTLNNQRTTRASELRKLEAVVRTAAAEKQRKCDEETMEMRRATDSKRSAIVSASTRDAHSRTIRHDDEIRALRGAEELLQKDELTARQALNKAQWNLVALEHKRKRTKSMSFSGYVRQILIPR